MKFNVMQITSGGRENDQCIGQVEIEDQGDIETNKVAAVQAADEEFGEGDGYSYIESAQ